MSLTIRLQYFKHWPGYYDLGDGTAVSSFSALRV